METAQKCSAFGLNIRIQTDPTGRRSKNRGPQLDFLIILTIMVCMAWSATLPSGQRGIEGDRSFTNAASGQDTIGRLGEALMRHEPWAARAVMDRYQPSVQRLLARMLGHGADVEDISQEVFLRLFARIDSLEEPAALRAYLHAIAVRVGCWELRRRAVRRAVLLSDSGTLPEPEQPLVNDQVQTELLRLSELLGQLGSAERRAFVLRRIERRTFNEIAADLGVSVSTAKRRVSRVINRVERVLSRESGLRFVDRSDDLSDDPPAPPEAPRSYSSVA